MKSLPFVILGCVVFAAPLGAADRLTDRDVKALVSRIEQDRDRFDDALDGRLKNSIVRGPNGEVNVKRFLDDFQENIDRLEGRLKPDYAASSEVATLLGQGASIDAYFREQPAGTKGASEWNRLATDLRTLASAYGSSFPLEENAKVRRMGDGEVAAAADQIASGAARLKKSIQQDLKKKASVDKASRDGLVSEAEELSKDAKALRERVKHGDPSSAEADRVLSRASKLQAALAEHQLPTAIADLTALRIPLESLASAYAVPSTGTR